MKAARIYAFVLGQVASLIGLGLLVHAAVTKDGRDHPVTLYFALFVIGQVPLIYLLRAYAAEAGKTIGGFAKDAVIPLIRGKAGE